MIELEKGTRRESAMDYKYDGQSSRGNALPSRDGRLFFRGRRGTAHGRGGSTQEKKPPLTTQNRLVKKERLKNCEDHQNLFHHWCPSLNTSQKQPHL
jgi:hypothetical protein